jgi:RyR domain
VQAPKGDWRQLPEPFLHANRAAADHIPVKKWDQASGADHLALAQVEHNRWCTERLLEGWAPAPDGKQDKLRKLHPSLKPWGALSDLDKDKDVDAVKTALGLKEPEA